MFPFIRDNGTLYFASNGHPGMGGLDIFMAERNGTNDEWTNATNMEAPITTSYNDFGIMFDGLNERGYLTSNRPGGRGEDDIWSFRIPPLKFIIAGTVTDLETGAAVANAKIKLLGTDGSSVELMTDELGYYEFDQVSGSAERYIKGETSYTLEVSKEKYLNGKGQETTVGLIKSTKLVHDFKIQPFSDVIVFPEVRYDLARWELQVNDSVNSKDSLDFLYTTLIENPNIVIELKAYTDSRGKDQANLELSQKRAQSCVDYLVSKGIPQDRMVAVGKGEADPVNTDEVINALPTKEEKEAAHQKNRRTVFGILRDDYVPATPPATDGGAAAPAQGDQTPTDGTGN
jgi:peptidoglycan-associated lipoprotein